MTAFIIGARIDANETAGMFVRDWFSCGVNDRSERYESEAAAIKAARENYLGPDSDGTECELWAEEME